MKYIIKLLIATMAVLLLCTACTNGAESEQVQELQGSEPQHKEVEFGHFKYSVPDYCEVKDTENDLQIYGDKTVIADGYVIRSYCVSGVHEELPEAVEMLYPGKEFEYIEIGKDDTAAYLLESVSETTDGKPMSVYEYHFMSEDVLHVFGVWSYTKELSDEAQAVIQSIEKTYTTLSDERQRAYEEDSERQHQQALQEYYEEQEPNYGYGSDYDYEPYVPPSAGGMRSRGGR